MAEQPVAVDFYYWEECPSHEEALARLKSVLTDEGIATVPRRIRVESEEQARALRFPGSPTVRVNGADIDAGGATGEYLLTCRVYTRADGRVSPLPPRDLLVAAIRQANLVRSQGGST